jgi:hypothetical protein
MPLSGAAARGLSVALLYGLAALQGMLLMDASEKMDSLNLLRCHAVTAVLVTMLTAKASCIYSLLYCPRNAYSMPCTCRWMAPIASLCLIPAVLVLEPTVIRYKLGLAYALPHQQPLRVIRQHRL